MVPGEDKRGQEPDPEEYRGDLGDELGPGKVSVRSPISWRTTHAPAR
jgi:hypothetical protein